MFGPPESNSEERCLMIPWIRRIVASPVAPLVLLSIVLAAASCGDADHGGDASAVEAAAGETVAEGNGGNGDGAGDGPGGGRENAPGVPVEVTRARIGDISSYLLLSSTVETESQVDVYSRATGLVAEILVEEGGRVRRGDVLARLDDEEYALDESAAEVKFRKLQNDFHRVEQMHRDNLISGEEYENARYELRQAELEWEKAKLLLKYTRIDSPIDGIVSRRLVSVGDRITTTTHVFSVVNLDSMIAVVYVPEREIDQVAVGQPARIVSDFLEGGPLRGWVKRISPVVDPNSGTFKVTVAIGAAREGLRPGMFVNVQIVTGTHTDAVLVPRDAVVYDGGREYIFLAGEDSTAKRVELEKGYSDNRTVEVLSGVGLDDRVIVVGQNGIKDGARIQILEERGDGGEGAAS
jgi:RND family efflux transporter MFP subunit